MDMSSQHGLNSSLVAESPKVPKKRGRKPKNFNTNSATEANASQDSAMDASLLEGNSSMIIESPTNLPQKRTRKPKNFYLDMDAGFSSASDQPTTEKSRPSILEVNGNSVFEAGDDLTPVTPTTSNGPKKRGRKPKTPQTPLSKELLAPTKIEAITPPATPISVRKSGRTPKPVSLETTEEENTQTKSTVKKVRKSKATEVTAEIESRSDRSPVKVKQVSNVSNCNLAYLFAKF